MVHRKTDDPKFEELAHLIKASFPNYRCLRCGNSDAYLISDRYSRGNFSREFVNSELINPEHPVVTLTCTRCGHLEQFVTTILENAGKPLPSPGLHRD